MRNPMERFRRWRAKTFTGSDAFCQGDLAAAEPSSKSTTNLTQQGTPVQVTTNVATKPSKAEATAAKKDAAAAAKLQKELSKQVTVKAKTKAVSTPGPAAPAQQSPAAGALHYMQPITISSQPSVKNLTPRSTPPQPQPLTKDPNLPSKSEPLRKEPSAPSKPEPLQKEPSVPSKPLHGILKGQQSGTPPVNSPALTPQTSGEPSGPLPVTPADQPAAAARKPQQPQEQSPEAAQKRPDAAQAKKRIAIAAEALTNASNVKIPNIPKNDAVLKLFEKATEHNLLFEMLPKSAKAAIFGSLAPIGVLAGTDIITQGDEGTKFYILEAGCCDVLVAKEEWGPQPRKVLSYSPGSGFGELALLYSAPRAATVRTAADCRLWVMERAVYNAIKHASAMQLAAEKCAMVAAVPRLSVLSQEHRDIVADALVLEEFEAGEVIYRQGDAGDRFYIIKEGTVVVSKGEGASLKVLDRLGDKAYFGERALVKTDTRSADVTADSYVACYTLRRQAFNKLLGPIEEVWKLEALRKVPVLFSLPEGRLQELSARMQTCSVAAGQVIFSAGDPGDSFYVIEDGTFLIYNGAGEELARVSKGSCFGELALLRQSVRAANVKALTEGTLLTLTRKDFDSLLGSLADIRHLWRFEALRMVPSLAGLSSVQRSQLCPAMKPVRVEAGRKILTLGGPNTFYVVEAGTCSVLGETGQEVARLGPTMYMGEAALLGMEPSRATVQALTAVDLLMLPRSEAVRVLGPAFIAQLGTQSSAPSAKKSMRLGDLTTITRLGAGAFGTVSLVKHDSSYYALKQMNKSQIVQMGLQEHVKREKQVMAECDCVFMVKLVASFKDATCIYMLLEAVMGGELFTYLQSRQRPLSEEHARFYAASVVLGLEYMQQRNLMWRDLKPENLLIDTQGYVKMADFGFAKKMPPGQKSYTLCGTPEYLAPELVTQSGHTKAVDWWAVGVLIFEMVAGYPPFYTEDRVTMFKNICHVKYTAPPHFSKDLKDLVKRILVANPAQRLGALKGGAADVKEHQWFAGFDWAAFSQRIMPAPYLPKVKSPEDASNFVEPPDDSDRDPQAARYQSVGLFKDF